MNFSVPKITLAKQLLKCKIFFFFFFNVIAVVSSSIAYSR